MTKITLILAISIGNGLLFLTVLMEKSLRNRKEMRIIATLCVADFVYGFGGLLLNGYRVLLLATGLSGVPSTAWDCIKWPHTFLAKIGAQLTAFMNAAVSVDRSVNEFKILFLGTDRFIAWLLFCRGSGEVRINGDHLDHWPRGPEVQRWAPGGTEGTECTLQRVGKNRRCQRVYLNRRRVSHFAGSVGFYPCAARYIMYSLYPPPPSQVPTSAGAKHNNVGFVYTQTHKAY